jgi:hypothetical protein
LVYAAADLTIAKDAGDGWVRLDAGWDSVNTFALGVFACIAVRNGSSGYAGLTLPASAAWTAITASYRLANARWDLSNACGSTAWYNASASATTLTPPAINQPYAQVIDFVGIGYNNGGTTTTVTNPSGFTERQDTGQTSPAHGISTNDRTAIILGAGPFNAGPTGASLAVAKTNRAVVRAMVPIIANTYVSRGRLRGTRRFF